MHRLVNEPSFLENIGDKGVRSLEDARRFISDGLWTNQIKQGHGQFAIERKRDGALIGVCGLLYREGLDVTDVGFAILPEFWRRGYAFEAATTAVDYGQEVLGIDRIVGLTRESNLASIKVLEKLGMRFERTVKMSAKDPGTALYS